MPTTFVPPSLLLFGPLLFNLLLSCEKIHASQDFFNTNISFPLRRYLGSLQILQADSFQEDSYIKYYLLHSKTSECIGCTYVLCYEGNVKYVSDRWKNENVTTCSQLRSLIVDLDNWKTGSYISIHASESIISLDSMHLKYIRGLSAPQYFTLSVHSIQNSLLDDPFSKSNETSPLTPLHTDVKLRRMVVIIVDMEDQQVSCSKPSIEDIMWKAQYSVKSMFESNSFGTVEFAGDITGQNEWDIFGPFKINWWTNDNRGCQAGEWADIADSLATQAGVKFENYQHRVYILPSETSNSCHWDGLGWIGCDGLFCRAWINTCDRMEVFVHELGHNLGMTHASSNINDRGYIITYGDPTALMGNNFFSSTDQTTFNAPHREMVGWFPSGKLLTISSSGLYSIAPLNLLPLNTPLPQTIKLIHPDTQYGFYFSYITLRSSFARKCLIHTLHNMTSSPSFFITALEANGRYYQDPALRFSVMQWSVSSNEMKLKIVFGCERGNTIVDFFSYTPILNAPFSAYNKQPAITYTNSTVVILPKGGQETLTLRVANTDSPLCTPVHYIMNRSVPSGWSIELEEKLMLTAGQHCFIDFKIIAPTEDQQGTDNDEVVIKINGTTEDDQSIPEHSTLITASVKISTSCIEGNVNVDILEGSSYYFASIPLEQIISIQNTDSTGCSPTNFKFSMEIPSDWAYEYKLPEISLKGGQKGYNVLKLIPPMFSQSNTTTVRVIIKDTGGKIAHTQSLRLDLIKQSLLCDKLPSVFIEDPFIQVPTRHSVRTVMEVVNENPSHCNPFTLLLVASDSRVAVVPPIMRLPSGRNRQFSVLMYTSSMKTSARTVNITADINIQDPFINSIYGNGNLSVSVVRTDCSRFSPGLALACAPRVDSTIGTFRCYYYLQNYDTWPCTGTTWAINITLWPALKWSYTNRGYFYEAYLFPQNGTDWKSFDIILEKNISSVEIAISVEDITTTDESLKALHSRWLKGTVPIGKCSRLPPKLTPWISSHLNMSTNSSFHNDTDLTLDIGDTIALQFEIKNNDDIFCGWAGQNFSGQPESRTLWSGQVHSPIEGWSGKFQPSVWSLLAGESRNISLYLTASGSELMSNETYNISVEIYDTSNRTEHRNFFHLNARVTFKCIRKPPTIVINKEKTIIPTGASVWTIFTVNVTNNDQGPNCTSVNFNFGIGVDTNLEQGWKVYADPWVLNKLKPNETASANIGIYNRENIPAGVDYPVTVSIEERDHLTHRKTISTILNVKCPIPRPVTHITTSTISPFYSFGLQAGPVFLQWEGCLNGLWCCCPCKYRIERNGKVIGISDYTNFTDSTKLEVGIKYVYTITTIDRDGIESPAQVCDNTIAVEIVPPSIKKLVIFMGASTSIIFFISLAVYTIYYAIMKRRYVVMRRKEKIVPEVYFFPQSFGRILKLLIGKIFSKCKKQKPVLNLKEVGDSTILLENDELDDGKEMNPDEVEMIAVVNSIK